MKKVRFAAGLFYFSPEGQVAAARYLAAMKTFTIELADEEQYQRLLQLARALGMGVGAPAPLSAAEQERHQRIIAKGGSGTSIPDPVAWQREIRADRPLPNRD